MTSEENEQLGKGRISIWEEEELSKGVLEIELARTTPSAEAFAELPEGNSRMMTERFTASQKTVSTS